MSIEITGLLVAIAAFAISWAVAEAIRRNATRLELVQNPNERSSHVAPTPSGGGVGIALAGTLAGGFILGGSGGYFWVTLGVGAAAAVMGLADDRFDLPSRLRLVGQLIMVGVLLAAVGALPAIGTLAQPVLYAVLLLAGVWWVNLFNFMDGIDGIASTEAVFILAGGASLSLLTGLPIGEMPVIWWAIAVAAACGGFLMLNWPPARMFMGDAGSNYLAITILAIALLLIARGRIDYPTLAILGAVFIADATVTLVRRALGRQRLLAAHRLHAYQKLSRRWGSHRRVTVLYTAINLFFLYPLAYLAHTNPQIGWLLVVVAFGPLAVVCVLSGAGRPDDTPAVSKAG